MLGPGHSLGNEGLSVLGVCYRVLPGDGGTASVQDVPVVRLLGDSVTLVVLDTCLRVSVMLDGYHPWLQESVGKTVFKEN